MYYLVCWACSLVYQTSKWCIFLICKSEPTFILPLQLMTEISSILIFCFVLKKHRCHLALSTYRWNQRYMLPCYHFLFSVWHIFFPWFLSKIFFVAFFILILVFHYCFIKVGTWINSWTIINRHLSCFCSVELANSQKYISHQTLYRKYIHNIVFIDSFWFWVSLVVYGKISMVNIT